MPALFEASEESINRTINRLWLTPPGHARFHHFDRKDRTVGNRNHFTIARCREVGKIQRIGQSWRAGD